jgi:hypothetical protein
VSRKKPSNEPVEGLLVELRGSQAYAVGRHVRHAGAPLTVTCVCGKGVRMLAGGGLMPHTGCDFTCEGTRAPLTPPASVPSARPTPTESRSAVRPEPDVSLEDDAAPPPPPPATPERSLRPTVRSTAEPEPPEPELDARWVES